MSEALTCILCGATGRDVANMLIRWKGDTYGHGPHCRDAWTCYLNVITQKEEWLPADIPRRPFDIPPETDATVQPSEYEPW
jgi:hypothetical protein